MYLSLLQALGFYICFEDVGWNYIWESHIFLQCIYYIIRNLKMLDETIYGSYIFLYGVLQIGNFLCRLKIVAIMTLSLHFLIMSRKNYKNTQFGSG